MRRLIRARLLKVHSPLRVFGDKHPPAVTAMQAPVLIFGRRHLHVVFRVVPAYLRLHRPVKVPLLRFVPGADQGAERLP